MKRILFALAILSQAGPCTAQSAARQRPLLTFEQRLDSFRRVVYKTPYLPFQLTLQDGRPVSRESLLGKVVLLDFWFELCHPCHADFGGLNALNDQMQGRSDFALVSIAREPAARIPALREKYGLRFDVAAAEDDSLIRSLNYQGGYPVKILLDKKGRVRYYASGGSGDSSVAHKKLMRDVYPKIQALLKEK